MALPTAADIQGRLEFDLTDNESGRDLTEVANNAIEDLFTEACHYGSSAWTEETLPAVVRTQIIRATVRYMRNPDGFTQSRAGDETVAWGSDEDAGAAHFTETQIEIIKNAADAEFPDFGSFGSYAWNNCPAQPNAIYVPVDGNGSPFPLFANPSYRRF
jgi:hypothetical protein